MMLIDCENTGNVRELLKSVYGKTERWNLRGPRAVALEEIKFKIYVHILYDDYGTQRCYVCGL